MPRPEHMGRYPRIPRRHQAADAGASAPDSTSATGQSRLLSRRALLSSGALGTLALLTAACGGQTAPATTAPVKEAPAAATPAAKEAAKDAPTAAPAKEAAKGGPTAAPAKEAAKGTVDEAAKDPFKVEPNVTIEANYFQGGWGVEFLKKINETFEQLHPTTKVNPSYVTRQGELLRPRFVQGNPPDVIYNGGAGSLDVTALVSDGALQPLDDVLEAPALDTPGAKVKDTLVPGSQSAGYFDNKLYAIKFVYFVWGIWYSEPLFKQNNWTYPTTWEKMLELCEQIKKDGKMAPWTYQGKFPGYMTSGVLLPMIWQLGGPEALLALDNLEPNAWKQEPVKQAVEAVAQLAVKGYIMPGTEGLTHTESQAEWLKGKAAFIPCGTWLENEMRSLLPPDFNMVMKPVPQAAASTKQPATSLLGAFGGDFIVPAKSKNPKAAKEICRILLSKQSAQFFAENVSVSMPVKGIDLSPIKSTAFKSFNEANEAAKGKIFAAKYAGWYSKLSTEVTNAMGAMLRSEMKPADFMEAAQKAADDVAKDPTIKKFKAEAKDYPG